MNDIYTFLDCDYYKEIEVDYCGGDFIGKKMEGFCCISTLNDPFCLCEYQIEEKGCPFGFKR
jgi:hypothetical protein